MRERRTRQLAAVYDTVYAALDHPTAEQVYVRVRRRLPAVSLGTVYRNLQKLAMQERVRVLHMADRVTRYDAMPQEHDHFVCEGCGQVTDVLRAKAPVQRQAVAPLGYRVHAHTVTLYGLCPPCLAGRRRAGSPGRHGARGRRTAASVRRKNAVHSSQRE